MKRTSNMAATLYMDLPGNVKMPAIGMGNSQVKDEAEAATALNAALECGYRHLDTAYAYQNEKIIGKILKEWFDLGKLKREEIFITTKLPMQGVHPDRVEFFMKKSLENLQLDYVDLYLVHFPIGLKYDVNSTTWPPSELELEGKTDHGAIWKKMEEQVYAGRAKNIGLSNYSIPQVETVLKMATIKPACLQVELHLHLQQRDIVDFCKINGIVVVAYCPLGSPGRNSVMQKLGLPPRKLPDILGDPVIDKISKKYSKTPAQIALRFLLQLGVAAIPKSVSPKRLQENINIFDFSLDDGDFEELSGVEVGESARIADFTSFRVAGFKSIKGFDQHPDFPLRR